MMKRFFKRVKGLLKNEKGQGMVEYGLILALIAIVVITSLSGLGKEVAQKFTDIGGKLQNTTIEETTDTTTTP